MKFTKFPEFRQNLRASLINSRTISKKLEKEVKMRVLSLFSGCGGLDLGFELAGHEVIFANDIYKASSETYSHNFPKSKFVLGKVENIKEFPEHDILVGGYPCQSFSIAGNLLVSDPRNILYKEFLRCLQQVKPKFFLAENVAYLAKGSRYNDIFNAMVKSYKGLGYNVKWTIFDAKDFGIPQDRSRVMIVGVREDINFEFNFPKPTHCKKDKNGCPEGMLPYTTLKEAIWGLQKNPGPTYEGRYPPRFMSRNRVRNWDEVSYTIVATANQNPMHPSTGKMEKVSKDKFEFVNSFVRRMSARECARIMSFPDSFEFKGDRVEKLYKQIGNAVPPLLAFKVARCFPVSQKNSKWIMIEKDYSYKDIVNFDMSLLK